MVVSDLKELFIPAPDDLLANLSDSRHVVDAFLNSLPTMFAKNQGTESCLGPALKAGFTVCKAIGGKVCVFQSGLPNLSDGALKHRENPRIMGTSEEVRTSQERSDSNASLNLITNNLLLIAVQAPQPLKHMVQGHRRRIQPQPALRRDVRFPSPVRRHCHNHRAHQEHRGAALHLPELQLRHRLAEVQVRPAPFSLPPHCVRGGHEGKVHKGNEDPQFLRKLLH